MNPRFKVSVILLFIGIGGSFYFRRNPTQAKQVPAQGLFQKALEFHGRPAQAATSLNASSSTLPKPNPSDCASFNEEIETLPLESLLSDLKDQKLKLPQNCELDSATRPLFEAVVEACAQEFLAKGNSTCETSLFQYRARRIELWSQGQDLKSLSTEVLVQKFFGILASNEFMHGPGNQEIRNVAEELKQRMPTSAAPYRLEVVSYLTAPDLTPEETEAYTEALQEARQRDPNDWQLFEIELFKTSQEDPFLYQLKVQNLLASNPRSAVGLYHAGCLAWKSGNRQEALDYFKQASGVDPQDKRMSDTLQKAQGDDMGASVCSASISFNPDSF